MMSHPAMATQVLAELELVNDYSTKRLILIESYNRVAEMARAECEQNHLTQADSQGKV